MVYFYKYLFQILIIFYDFSQIMSHYLPLFSFLYMNTSPNYILKRRRSNISNKEFENILKKALIDTVYSDYPILQNTHSPKYSKYHKTCKRKIFCRPVNIKKIKVRLIRSGNTDPSRP